MSSVDAVNGHAHREHPSLAQSWQASLAFSGRMVWSVCSTRAEKPQPKAAAKSVIKSSFFFIGRSVVRFPRTAPVTTMSA